MESETRVSGGMNLDAVRQYMYICTFNNVPTLGNPEKPENTRRYSLTLQTFFQFTNSLTEMRVVSCFASKASKLQNIDKLAASLSCGQLCLLSGDNIIGILSLKMSLKHLSMKRMHARLTIDNECKYNFVLLDYCRIQKI